MSIIEMPMRPRRVALLAKQEPATVVKHPSVPHEFAAEAIAKMREDGLRREAAIEADRQLAIVYRDLETIGLKAGVLAGMHGREDQVIRMFETALFQLKAHLGRT